MRLTLGDIYEKLLIGLVSQGVNTGEVIGQIRSLTKSFPKPQSSYLVIGDRCAGSFFAHPSVCLFRCVQLSTEVGITGRPIHLAMFRAVMEDSSTVRGSAKSLLQLTTEAIVTVHRLNLCPAPANHAVSEPLPNTHA